MAFERSITYEQLLDKLGQPSSWFRDGPDAHEKRERYIMEQLQNQFPGKYTLEEYYNPNTMSFRYRLKFDSEADEMWFRLKYE